MAKKHLDANMFKDICKNEMHGVSEVPYNCGEYEVAVRVKPYTTMQEKQDIAETVWGCCYKEEDGEYRQAAYEPALRMMVLYFYCDNLKLDLGKGLSPYYDFLMNTGFYDAIIEHVQDFDELNDVVWSYVSFKKMMLEKSDIDRLLASLLATLNKKLGEVDVDGLLEDVRKVAAAAEDGNIVEKVLERYGQGEPNLTLVKPEGDADGNDHGSAGESDTEED